MMLALAMCLGLTGTALAAEDEHDHEGFDAISVDFGDAVYKECDPKLQVYTGDNLQGGIIDTSTGFWTFEGKGYWDVKPGQEITVTNVGTDPSAYVYVYLWRYNYYSSSQKVDIWLEETETLGKLDVQGAYFGTSEPITLCSQSQGNGYPRPYGENAFTPVKTINDMKWVLHDSVHGEKDNVKALASGESITFTLPEMPSDRNMLYQLMTEVYYPDCGRGCYYWSGNYVKCVGDQPAEPVRHAPPTIANAAPTAAAVLVNGEDVSFEAYNIADNNYFKLRDLAYILNDTGKQFEVSWDDAANAISLTSNAPYTAVGGEMDAKKTEGTQRATLSTSLIYLDGEIVFLDAYKIGDNNYFKLRDVGAAFDFGVDWDATAGAIRIDTTKGYTPD